jgi:hypothetical protein
MELSERLFIDGSLMRGGRLLSASSKTSGAGSQFAR